MAGRKVGFGHYTHNYIILLIIFLLFVINRSDANKSLGNSFNTSTAIDVLISSIDLLSEKLRRDLNYKFGRLSSQLDENDRKLSKTLSIFEKEWKEKSGRIEALEERQDKVESAVMILQALLKKLELQIERQHHNTSSVQIQTDLPTSTNRIPSLDFTSYEDIDIDLVDDRTELAVVEVTESGTEVIGSAANSGSDISYYIAGSPTAYQHITEPIPLSEQSKLTSIEFQYVILNPKILAASLQNCSKLESLKLIQVRLEDNTSSIMTTWPRVTLSNLQEFVLDLVDILSFRNDTIFSKWAEVDDFLKSIDKERFKNLIFFDKYPNTTWNPEDISNIRTNIQILIDGIKIFTLNFDNGELNSMLAFTNDFLGNLDPEFFMNQIAASSWRLDLESLPESVTHLNFNYVLDSNEINFSKKLSRFQNLQELNFFLGNQRYFDWSFSIIPNLGLRNLTIRYSDLADFPKNQILRLDQLVLHLCQIDPDFIDSFSRVFEAVRVGIIFRRVSDSRTSYQTKTTIPKISHHYFLTQILNTPVQWIFMAQFERNFSRSGIPLNPTTARTYGFIERFLARSGIKKGIENFVLVKQNDTWTGTELVREDVNLITFQLVGTSKFITFEAYNRIVT